MTRHLHVVTDEPATKRPRGRAPGLSLSAEESRHLRAAIRGLVKTRYASLGALARELGVDTGILSYRRRRLSPGLAVAVWRLTGVPVEVLLSGKLAVVPATLGPAPEPPCAG